MTLGTFRGAFQSARDMASRRDHGMESMPAPPDCHSCVFLYKKRQWENCLPAGLVERGEEVSYLYGIFLLSTSQKGYMCLLIEPWNFWGGSSELG